MGNFPTKSAELVNLLVDFKANKRCRDVFVGPLFLRNSFCGEGDDMIVFNKSYLNKTQSPMNEG